LVSLPEMWDMMSERFSMVNLSANMFLNVIENIN
jgi:hypothetical protein